MTGTEARETALQLPLTGAPKPTLRSKALKTGKDELVLPVISLHSSDRLTVLYGHPLATQIALQTLVDHALSGQPVVYLDGLHTFDVFLVERLVQNRRQQLQKALAMIHVARTFSAQQLERLLSHCLVDALERYQARTAMISGLLETLSADRVTDKEVNRMTERIVASVHHLTSQGFSLLCPCPSVPNPIAPTHRLFAILRSMSHRCIQVTPSPSNPDSSALQFSYAPVAQLDRAAVS